MKQIGIVAALHKSGIDGVLRRVVDCLEGWGINVFLAHSCAELLGDREGYDLEQLADVDCVVALGGDGSVLSAARVTAARGTPILGVRIGGLGFLSEVDEGHVEAALAKVRDGDYTLESRAMLAARVLAEGDLAWEAEGLNDAALLRTPPSPLAVLHIEVSGQLACEYPADGVIVATPTGSSAYSLAAGGPVVHPQVPAFIVTPVCPHTSAARPFLVADSEEVVISLRPGLKTDLEVELVVDGQLRYGLGHRDKVCVARSDKSANLVRLGGQPFFERMRQKLSWGER